MSSFSPSFSVTASSPHMYKIILNAMSKNFSSVIVEISNDDMENEDGRIEKNPSMNFTSIKEDEDGQVCDYINFSIDGFTATSFSYDESEKYSFVLNFDSNVERLFKKMKKENTSMKLSKSENSNVMNIELVDAAGTERLNIDITPYEQSLDISEDIIQLLSSNTSKANIPAIDFSKILNDAVKNKSGVAVKLDKHCCIGSKDSSFSSLKKFGEVFDKECEYSFVLSTSIATMISKFKPIFSKFNITNLVLESNDVIRICFNLGSVVINILTRNVD